MKLMPGIRLLSSRDNTSKKDKQPVLTTTQAGFLSIDHKRSATTVSITTFPRRRYTPAPTTSAEYFHCTICPNSPQAYLGQLAFEGATKKTRPMLKADELVYARVASVGVGEVELTCVNPATGKAEPDGLGPLNGGMVFDAAYEPDKVWCGCVGAVGKGAGGAWGFEVAVGKNGKVWVDCSAAGEAAVKATVAIGRCLTETGEKVLDATDQKKLVTRVLKEMELSQ
ncbi:exosome non-catalytic core subunit rrp40 [Ascosphaera atra]|nr:exosome non-catalytic core subunit rrp40 [Ascosphaera atra]